LTNIFPFVNKWDNFQFITGWRKNGFLEKNELVVLGEKRGGSLPDAAINI
jgi:hypothetical protein